MPRYETTYRYKPPIFLRAWFQILVVLVLSGLVAGGVAVYLHVQPFHAKAQEFDLSLIHKLEKASIIYDRSGQELGRIFVLNRDPVPLEKVPRHMIEAVVATEDSRFFDHDGVDRMGILRATLRNLKDRSNTQGASTITQQLARNSFGIFEKSYRRKLVEAFLAMRIEKNFSKSEIMEMYLNRIYFGSGFYGVNAASKGYFGKEVSEIGVDEAAILAGLIRSPHNLSPFNNPKASQNARNHVLNRMVEEGMITAEMAKSLIAQPVKTKERGGDRKRAFEYAYERIRQRVVAEIGYQSASEGGFHIYTTIDSTLQEAAHAALVRQLAEIENHPTFEGQTYGDYEKILDQWKKEKISEAEEAEGERKPPPPQYLQGAVLAIDNRTGAVRALVGGRDYAHSNFDRTVQARRKTGTAFTPFVYAAGYSRRPTSHYPGSKVEDSPMDNMYVQIGGTGGILGEWGIETAFNEPEGLMPARRALVLGKNAATVRFGIEVGLPKVVDFAKRAGITFEGEIQNFNSTFLGNSEAGISEMALAYSTFPNLGRRPKEVYIISAIRDENMRVRFKHDAKDPEVEVCDPYTAYQIHASLEESLRHGTGSVAYQSHGMGDYPAAGKTGTAYDFRDQWFVGYTDQLTCAVWAGFDLAKPVYLGAFSNRTVLPAWVEFMNKANGVFPASRIQPPGDAVPTELCRISGDPATEHCQHAESVEGESRQIRDTYVEYLPPGFILKHKCLVHGPGGQLDRTRLVPNTDPFLTDTLPTNRARILGGYSRPLKAVSLQADTVIGPDPYDSLRPKTKPPVRAVPIAGAPSPAAPAPAGPVRAVPITPTPMDAGSPPPTDPNAFRENAPPPVIQGPAPLGRTEDGLPSVLETVRGSTAPPPPQAVPIQFD
jgi:penicillin-binding protein 1A